MISKETFNIISKNCRRREPMTGKCWCNDTSNICDYDTCPHRLNPMYRKQNPLTPEQFEREILKLHKDYLIDRDDEERCHIEMDNLICGLLTDLGYGGGIYIFDQTPKWYA